MGFNIAENILNETAFSMDMEGFAIPEDEKETIRQVLLGNLSFEFVLKQYIDNAVKSGGADYVRQ